MLVYEYRTSDGVVSGAIWLDESVEAKQPFIDHVKRRHGAVTVLWVKPVSDPDRVRLLQALKLLGAESAENTTSSDNWMIKALEAMLTSALRAQAEKLAAKK